MTVRVRIVRADDLLHVHVEAVNMTLDLADPAAPQLVVEDQNQEAYLVVGFPPQAVVEEAVFDPRPAIPAPVPQPPLALTEPKAPSKPAPNGVLRSRISDISRLVFIVPPNRAIPFTVAGLLDWHDLEPRLSPLAAPPRHPTSAEADAAGPIEAPGSGLTGIELPYRLLISPDLTSGWQHRTAPKTHQGRTELWHTRLMHRDRDGALTPISRTDPAPIRAIWSPDFPGPPVMGEPDHDWDYDPPNGRFGVLTPMTPSDRREIVALTAGFNGFLKGLIDPPAVDESRFEPTPVDAEQVMLSPLGGWLRSRGSWSPPMPWVPRRGGIGQRLDRPGPSLNISEWVHTATAGRDHYVRIVYEGVVHPFGHRASLIKITERKIRNRSDGSPVAFLAQRMFVVIRQPLKDYSNDRQEPAYARAMLLRTVRLTTLITPDIDTPVPLPRNPVPPPPARSTSDAFWITVAGSKFRFTATGIDLAGHPVDFSTTLIFIPFSSLKEKPALDGVRQAHITAGEDRACPVPGQRVSYAEPLAGAATDNTTQTTQSLYFTSEIVGVGLGIRFRPRLHKAAVRLPAVEQLLGTNTPAEIALRPEYLAQGFQNNPAGLFAYIAKEPTPGALVQAAIAARFTADQAGGVATPNLSISALTREHGPMAGSDLARLAAGDFDPAAFFADFAATVKLFGTIPLIEVLVHGSLADQAPKVELVTDTAAVPTKLIATLTWTPGLRSTSVGVVSVNLDAATFRVIGRVERLLQPGATPPKSEFSGELTAFTVELLNVVALHFTSFSFASVSGRKPSVNVALANDPLTFAGDLDFVNELKNFIPPGLFGDNASLDVTPSSVTAGFGIGLPPIAIGVFSLEGINLRAYVQLPFADGRPRFDFAVSAREHPACLTVAFLGGGAFFHIQIDTQGILLLEAALEFGASASINLGVASGGVHIMAGVYFAMGKKNGKDYAILSGYLRMGGELSVLGLISISLEFVLSFGYEDGKAAGRATLTVKVEIAFFSKSVEISVEKKFGGSSGDPRFLDVIQTPQIWADYASAYA